MVCLMSLKAADRTVMSRFTVAGTSPLVSRWSRKSYEGPEVEPVFATKEEAISYAQVRACFRSGEIRIADASGRIERVIRFNDAERKM